ncbi:MAG: tRNA (adenosine(37)-N6)-threonylcarbamoyltransferase complex transferase subunit TsaD [Planctomycetota bacterium]
MSEGRPPTTILGFETSCDETACAVVRHDAGGTRVLGNAIATQVDLHEGYGGVVPEIAGRAHVERLIPVLRRALRDAGADAPKIDAVAVGHRPGLIGSLLVGVAAAKAAAFALGVPIIGVDHVHAHLVAGLLDAEADPVFPALGLVVSGGHTAMYRMASDIDVERIASTRDDALGEAYDKAATILGLAYPGGPKLDALAQEQGADDRAFDLPVSRLEKGSLDFSFSGLKTAVLYEVNGVPHRPGAPERPPVPPMTDARRRDLAASFQRAACRAIVLKITRALEQALDREQPYRSLLVGGGVTANSRLRRELQDVAAEHDLELRLPAMGFCLDNAAMIAGLGGRLLADGDADDLTLRAHPSSAL